MDNNFYIGQWIDYNLKDGEDIIRITSVTNDGIASTADGKQITIKDLDLSGRYKKIMAPTDMAEIKNEISSMGFKPSESAPKSTLLGDLSKIGKHNKTSEQDGAEKHSMNESHNTAFKNEADPGNLGTEQTYAFERSHEPITADPVSAFIESAIAISKQSGANGCKIPVTILIDFDFDILKVIEMCMQIGASDIEILQKLLKKININESDIKNSIARELLQTPDADIVIENREDSFNKVLTEELDRNATINGIPAYDPEKP